jgi:hypothetical protein
VEGCPFLLRDRGDGGTPPFLFCMLVVRRAPFPIGPVVPFSYFFGACVRWAYPSCARRPPLAIAHFFFLGRASLALSFLLLKSEGGLSPFSFFYLPVALPAPFSLFLERLSCGGGLSASRRRLTLLLGPRRPWPVGVKPFYHSYLSNLDRRS